MNDTATLQPVTLPGSNISYISGSMENYFRALDMPYELNSMR